MYIPNKHNNEKAAIGIFCYTRHTVLLQAAGIRNVPRIAPAWACKEAKAKKKYQAGRVPSLVFFISLKEHPQRYGTLSNNQYRSQLS